MQNNQYTYQTPLIDQNNNMQYPPNHPNYGGQPVYNQMPNQQPPPQPIYVQPYNPQMNYQQQSTTINYNNQNPMQYSLEEEEKLTMLLFVLGFFTSITWCICWCMFKNSQSETSRKWARYSKIGLIVYICLLTAFFIIYFGLMFILMFAFI